MDIPTYIDHIVNALFSGGLWLPMQFLKYSSYYVSTPYAMNTKRGTPITQLTCSC